VTPVYKNGTPEPVGTGHEGPRRGPAQQADEEAEDIYSNSTLAEKADEATKLSKFPTLTLKKIQV
jgi:hypothetical protein